MMTLRTLTIEELSNKSGISKNHIYCLLNGKNKFTTMSCIKKLSAALGCTPAWLLRDIE